MRKMEAEFLKRSSFVIFYLFLIGKTTPFSKLKSTKKTKRISIRATVEVEPLLFCTNGDLKTEMLGDSHCFRVAGRYSVIFQKVLNGKLLNSHKYLS